MFTWGVVALLLIVLQQFIAVVQYKDYQNVVRGMRHMGLLGIGARKGGFRTGEIIILSYDKSTGKINACKRLHGIFVFEKFRDIPHLVGLSLDEVRKIGIARDAILNRRYRKKHPYDFHEPSKKKAALIQAVEAIARRLERDGELADNILI